MENKELSNIKDTKTIAQEFGINEKIIRLIDNGSLQNWNGIRNLPDRIRNAFSNRIKDKEYNNLIIGNILAATAKDMIDLLQEGSMLVNKTLTEEEKVKLTTAAIVLFSYPKGIEPTNPNISLQIPQESLQKLEKTLRGISQDSIQEELEKRGFILKQGNYSRIINPQELANLISEI